MNIFSHIQTKKPKLNKFDLGHEKKLSLKMGKLYPILLQEVIPGDKMKCTSEIMLRMAPMIAPVMHRVNVKTEYFFVPHRLVWDEWEDFITGGEDGNAEPVHPSITINNASGSQFVKGSLADYFGIPVTDPDNLPSQSTQVSALQFRAYQTIYNEYYRDQNLEQKVPVSKASGNDANGAETTQLRNRAWEKDYFTSALPFPQRGGEAVLPLGTVTPNYLDQTKVYNAGVGEVPTVGDLSAEVTTGNLQAGIINAKIANLDDMPVDPISINELRKANALQTWLEISARGGSRYIEQIKSIFGITSSDARLQRPEYLGGGRQPIVISEVLNTVGVDGQAPQGDMAGHGISVGSGNHFKASFEEHGTIIGIMSVIPKTTYQQGLDRNWQKFDKFDHYFPQFAHLGEQEVLQQEVFLDFDDPVVNDGTFGYQQRYAEYKYKQSSVHGDFRDNLRFWHMGRFFDTPPALNEQFVQSDPTTRIFAVVDPTIDTMYCQIYNNLSALRPMPYFSVPSL